MSFEWLDGADALVSLAGLGLDLTIFQLYFYFIDSDNCEYCTPHSAKTFKAFIIVFLFLCWWWLLDLIMPFYKLWDKEGYYKWLGDPDWSAPCVNDQEYQEAMRPRTALWVNFVYSHIILTIFSLLLFLDPTSDDNTTPNVWIFILKVLVAVFKAGKACKVICFDLDLAKKHFKNDGRGTNGESSAGDIETGV